MACGVLAGMGGRLVYNCAFVAWASMAGARVFIIIAWPGSFNINIIYSQVATTYSLHRRGDNQKRLAAVGIVVALSIDVEDHLKNMLRGDSDAWQGGASSTKMKRGMPLLCGKLSAFRQWQY